MPFPQLRVIGPLADDGVLNDGVRRTTYRCLEADFRYGQSRQFGNVRATSAFALKADIHTKLRHVSNLPTGDINCRDCDVAEPEPNRQVFVKFRHLLRKAAARSAETICVIIGEILRAFTFAPSRLHSVDALLLAWGKPGGVPKASCRRCCSRTRPDRSSRANSASAVRFLSLDRGDLLRPASRQFREISLPRKILRFTMKLVTGFLAQPEQEKKPATIARVGGNKRA